MINDLQKTPDCQLPTANCLLSPGMVIRLAQSGLAEVISVNEFRARVRSLNKRDVSIHTAFSGDVNFSASGREWDISPNSEVEIIQKNPLSFGEGQG